MLFSIADYLYFDKKKLWVASSLPSFICSLQIIHEMYNMQVHWLSTVFMWNVGGTKIPINCPGNFPSYSFISGYKSLMFSSAVQLTFILFELMDKIKKYKAYGNEIIIKIIIHLHFLVSSGWHCKSLFLSL